MSEVFRTEKFPEDANTISVLFFRNKFGNFDLLTSFHRSLRNFAISHTVSVWQIKNNNASVLRLLCMK